MFLTLPPQNISSIRFCIVFVSQRIFFTKMCSRWIRAYFRNSNIQYKCVGQTSKILRKKFPIPTYTKTKKQTQNLCFTKTTKPTICAMSHPYFSAPIFSVPGRAKKFWADISRSGPCHKSMGPRVRAVPGHPCEYRHDVAAGRAQFSPIGHCGVHLGFKSGRMSSLVNL